MRSLWTAHAALIGRLTGGVVPGVDRWAPGPGEHRLGRAAVVGERTQHRIYGPGVDQVWADSKQWYALQVARRLRGWELGGEDETPLPGTIASEAWVGV